MILRRTLEESGNLPRYYPPASKNHWLMCCKHAGTTGLCLEAARDAQRSLHSTGLDMAHDADAGRWIVPGQISGFFLDSFIKSWLCYIIGPPDEFIQVDMILNYMFRLGLRGTCIYRNSTNFPNTRSAPNIPCVFPASINTCSSKSKTTHIV